MPEYIVSSFVIKPVPVRRFLREVVWAFKFLNARSSPQYLSILPRKSLYKDVVYVSLPVPLYRSVCGNGKDVLRRVKKMPIKASSKIFFFQLHSRTLPVKPWLQEKGALVACNINCRVCNKPETTEHIFIYCYDARFHWDILLRTLKKDLPVTPHDIRFLPVEKTESGPFDMLVVLSLRSLWRPRMADRNADLDARPTRVYYVENIAFVREVYRAQNDRPEQLPVLDDLFTLERFKSTLPAD